MSTSTLSKMAPLAITAHTGRHRLSDGSDWPATVHLAGCFVQSPVGPDIPGELVGVDLLDTLRRAELQRRDEGVPRAVWSRSLA